jgi:FkbM family methyltransferase
MIRFRSRGLSYPAGAQKILLKLLQWSRRGLQAKVFLKDKQFDSVFVCSSLLDASRPMSLWVKEEGTMRWLDDGLRPGDAFMDIGANIGIYTIAAAHRVGPTGKAYAFEPHKENVLSLMRNVSANRFNDRVAVFSCALSDRPAIAEFNYSSIGSASSGSQFGHTRKAGQNATFNPVAREMVLATSVDALIADGTVKPPALVKIDVDGNELPILKGMSELLSGPHRPRSLQVEMNVGEQDAIRGFLASHGYEERVQHHTAAGKKAAARGVANDQIAYNAVFQPVHAS